ncbi:unnamed protein product [Prunus brigantina]
MPYAASFSISSCPALKDYSFIYESFKDSQFDTDCCFQQKLCLYTL